MSKPKTNVPAAPQKGAEAQGASDILNDLKSEVSVEAAPLMTFIIRNARAIMIGLGVFLVLVAAGGAWRWHSGKVAAESHDSLSRAVMYKQGAEKARALEELAARDSGAARMAALLELGGTWLALGEYDKAAAAYKALAQADGGGVLGSMAAINEAGALSRAGKNADALVVLEAIEPAVPESARGPVRNMMAETALALGKTRQAADIFNTLSAAASGPEAEYYRYRVQNLEAADKGPAPEKNTSNSNPR